jgi:cytochrome c oxidase cbb3-type subunit IV
VTIVDATYKAFAELAQTWGLLFFVVVFFFVVAYALWPANKKRFDEAARLPLDEDD